MVNQCLFKQDYMLNSDYGLFRQDYILNSDYGLFRQKLNAE